jgi:bis(5'-adenosyl)-triphosphatase
MDLDSSELAEFAIFAQRVTGFLQYVFNSVGFNWTIQEGEAAGQSVMHLHLHIIPRTAGDLPHPGDWYPRLRESVSRHIDDETRPRLTRQQMDSVVEHLRREWKNY